VRWTRIITTTIGVSFLSLIVWSLVPPPSALLADSCTAGCEEDTGACDYRDYDACNSKCMEWTITPINRVRRGRRYIFGTRPQSTK